MRTMSHAPSVCAAQCAERVLLKNDMRDISLHAEWRMMQAIAVLIVY